MEEAFFFFFHPATCLAPACFLLPCLSDRDVTASQKQKLDPSLEQNVKKKEGGEFSAKRRRRKVEEEG